jgi:N-acetylglucosamine-6-phosphate deacetylase
VAPTRRPPAGAREVDLHGCFIVPGFVDVHVHGVEGCDTLDAPSPIAEIARRLTRYGVTAFCPTTVACSPAALRTVLAAVGEARATPIPGGARVLPAHLESNFINPEYRGAQPLACLRLPPAAGRPADGPGPRAAASGPVFTAEDILAEIAAARPSVGILTVAPELEGAIALIQELVAHGHRVSLGHSAATYDEGLAGIAAGARGATHLFNRMPPLHHRRPGLAGAVLESGEVAAEIVCDGYHVHPAMLRAAVASKGPARTMAITDGTAGSGLPVGSRGALGGRTITVRESAAFLDDGTLAGSVLTMDRAFRLLVETVELSLVDAATMCATTPARELGLDGLGRIAAGALADLAVLDGRLHVTQTWVAGELVFDRRRHA